MSQLPKLPPDAWIKYAAGVFGALLVYALGRALQARRRTSG